MAAIDLKPLIISSIFFLQLQVATGSEYVNIAMHKPVAQTKRNIGAYYPATNAVDADKGPSMFDNTCTHTSSGYNNWWVVDLLASYPIHKISIVNRLKQSQRLTGFKVYVSKKNPLPIPSANSSDEGQVCLDFPGELPHSGPHYFDCLQKPLIGRYVYVRKPGNNDVLTLCDFEVLVENNSLPVYPGHLKFSSGIKTRLTPYHSTTLRIASKMDCVVACRHAKGGVVTLSQLEESSGVCECIEKSTIVDNNLKKYKSVGWILIEDMNN